VNVVCADIDYSLCLHGDSRVAGDAYRDLGASAQFAFYESFRVSALRLLTEVSARSCRAIATRNLEQSAKANLRSLALRI
jgi:hypothetical protein